MPHSGRIVAVSPPLPLDTRGALRAEAHTPILALQTQVVALRTENAAPRERIRDLENRLEQDLLPLLPTKVF